MWLRTISEKKGINLKKINEVYMIVRKEDSEDRNYVIVL